MKKLTTDIFIKRAKKIHGDKYDYSKVKYIDSHSKVCIICPIHGEFWQMPYQHLSGNGCRKCQYITLKNKFLSNNFIEDAKKIHGNKYDYSKVKYNGNKEKVCIICPKHGEFWQVPSSHLQGVGCPRCQNSKIEDATSKALMVRNVAFINRHHFNWLHKQHLDFYLPNYNIAIECQGIQHFKGWGGEIESLNDIQKRDKKKKELCENNNVKLYYINYDDDVETKVNEILKEVCHNL